MRFGAAELLRYGAQVGRIATEDADAASVNVRLSVEPALAHEVHGMLAHEDPRGDEWLTERCPRVGSELELPDWAMPFERVVGHTPRDGDEWELAADMADAYNAVACEVFKRYAEHELFEIWAGAARRHWRNRWPWRLF